MSTTGSQIGCTDHPTLQRVPHLREQTPTDIISAKEKMHLTHYCPAQVSNLTLGCSQASSTRHTLAVPEGGKKKRICNPLTNAETAKEIIQNCLNTSLFVFLSFNYTPKEVHFCNFQIGLKLSEKPAISASSL